MRANKSVKRMPAEEITQLRDLLPRADMGRVRHRHPGDLEATVTRAALVAADMVVLAVECKQESVYGLDETMDLLNGRIANLRRGLPPQRLWLAPSRQETNSVSREVVDQLCERVPGQVTNPVPEATVIAETYMAFMLTRLYRPRSKGAKALAIACQTIITGEV